MKKFIGILTAALVAVSISGCTEYKKGAPSQTETSSVVTVSESTAAGITPKESGTPPQSSEAVTEVSSEKTEVTTTEEITTAETAAEKIKETTTTAAVPPETTSAKTEKTTVTETSAEKLSVEKDGSYTTPEDVAEYIHTFGTLPNNFITKSEAKELGWDNKKGNLWDVAEGKSIGGDRFGNYEGLLPEKKGRKYTECDVNYSGGYRGSERVIFSNDGLIYYTDDHYQTFTQLY